MNNKKYYFIFIILCGVFLLFLILMKKIQDKQEENKKHIEKFNYPNNSWDTNLSIPSDSQVVCLKKYDFPENLNILNNGKNSNNSIILEILNYLKKDIIDHNLFNYNQSTNEITLNINPNLKFEDGELITAKTLKHTLKIYIDCGLTKDLLDKLDKINDYVIEYREMEKKQIFDDLIKIDDNQKITIKLKKMYLLDQLLII